jgi:hypothetical protein
MEKIFGSNWRTTAWAVLSGVISFVATYPDILEPMPDYWEGLVKKIMAFLIAGGLIKLGMASADVVKSKEIKQELEEKIKEVKYEKF